MKTLFRAGHSQKAKSSIEVTEPGIVTALNEPHSKNALSSMEIIPCGIIYSMNSSILRLCIVFAVSFLSTCGSISLLGLEQDERAYFISKFKNIMLKFNKV